MSRTFGTRLIFALVGALAIFTAQNASADRMIIKQPGAHLNYSFEAEPHLLLDPHDAPGRGSDDGFGVGFRGTIPVVDNGFVSSINNNVGIGFGLDWVSYRRYYDCDGRGFNCDDGRFTRFWIPVVMQWNFFLSQNWSLFGEPGGTFHLTDDDIDLDPVIFIGARWHFSQTATLTMRLGYPTFSLGVSFFP